MLNEWSLYKRKIISDIKSIIRLIISIGLYYSGAIELFRYLKKKFKKTNGIKILTYHDISDKSYLGLHIPPEVFYNHIDYLITHNYNIISLVEAVNLLKNDEPIPADTVVITFDDVYKSFYTTVFPIVKKYRVPVTIFICTEPIETRIPLFIDALIYAFENTSKKKIDLTSWNLKVYQLNSYVLKEDAIAEINEYSKKLNTEDRRKFLEFIFNQLEIDLYSQTLSNEILLWDEIIEMSKNDFIEFGAHTINHSSLSRISIDEVSDEIWASKFLIQQRLDKEIKLFAYPFGSSKDISEEVKTIVAQNGFLCGCSLHKGDNKKGEDLFLLKRMCVSNQIHFKPLRIFSKAVFATQMSGILNYPPKLLKIKNTI